MFCVLLALSGASVVWEFSVLPSVVQPEIYFTLLQTEVDHPELWTS